MPALSNVAITDTFNTWRIRTNEIIVKGNQDETITLAAYDKANSANVLAFQTGIGANAFTSATIAGANTAVGTGANAYMIAVQNGSNTAVGAGANAFTSATIAGANTAVGAGANAFATASVSGVGSGANAYANLVWSRSNTYMTTTIAGANTAVGAGANAYALTLATAGNNFTISLQNGSNTAVGAGANAWSNTKLANTTGITFQGNLTISTSLGIGTPASGVLGEIRAANNITAYYSDRRLKEIKYNIPNAIEKVTSLSGIIYINNDVAEQYGYNNKDEQVGVIAQEVEQVLPQIVKLAPFDTEYVDGIEKSKSGENYKTVQYEKLIPLLIEAIKEQQKQIDELRKQKFCTCPTTDKT